MNIHHHHKYLLLFRNYSVRLKYDGCILEVWVEKIFVSAMF